MICRRCREGDHQHDRHTGVAGPAGTDAGCPYLTSGGGECTCSVIVGLGKACPHCHGTGRVAS